MHTDGAAKSRIRFSRICVEIDASPDFVEDFYLSCDNGDWITVFAELEWGWAPNRCSTCKVFGHSESVCTRKVNQASALPGKSSSEDEWTEVTKRKKGKEADPPVLSALGPSQEAATGPDGAPLVQVTSTCSPWMCRPVWSSGCCSFFAS